MKLGTKCKCGNELSSEKFLGPICCPKCGTLANALEVRPDRTGLYVKNAIIVLVSIFILLALLFSIPTPHGYDDYRYRVSTTVRNLESMRAAIETYNAMTGKWTSPDLRELYTTQFSVGGRNRTLLKSIPHELISTDQKLPPDMNPPNARVFNQLNGEGGWFYDPASGQVFVNWNQPLPEEWGAQYSGQVPSNW